LSDFEELSSNGYSRNHDKGCDCDECKKGKKYKGYECDECKKGKKDKGCDSDEYKKKKEKYDSDKDWAVLLENCDLEFTGK
jgi:hypothetical protein